MPSNTLTEHYLIAAVLACLCIAVTARPQSTPRPVPVIDLKDIHGRPISLANYKGKVVLLNFWATWCPPCRIEIPDLIKLQEKYRGQGLRIIGITYPPEKKSEVFRFARRLGINYRVAIGTKETKTVFTDSDTLPMTVVIDSEGRIQSVIEGIMYSDEFNRIVKPLLSSATKPERTTSARVTNEKGSSAALP